MRAAPRQPGEEMETYVYEMNQKRKELAEAMGFSEGQEHLAINDRLHGLHILRRSRISKLEQRQIKQKNLVDVTNPDEAVSSTKVGDSLTTTYFDVHEDEGSHHRRRQSRARPRQRSSYLAHHEREAREGPHRPPPVARGLRRRRAAVRDRPLRRASWPRSPRRARALRSRSHSVAPIGRRSAIPLPESME